MKTISISPQSAEANALLRRPAKRIFLFGQLMALSLCSRLSMILTRRLHERGATSN